MLFAGILIVAVILNSSNTDDNSGEGYDDYTHKCNGFSEQVI